MNSYFLCRYSIDSGLAQFLHPHCIHTCYTAMTSQTSRCPVCSFTETLLHVEDVEDELEGGQVSHRGRGDVISYLPPTQ